MCLPARAQVNIWADGGATANVGKWRFPAERKGHKANIVLLGGRDY